MPKPTPIQPRRHGRRFLFGPVTRSVLMQRRRGELDCSNPLVYARLLRTAIETDRWLRDGLVPAHDRHIPHPRRAVD